MEASVKVLAKEESHKVLSKDASLTNEEDRKRKDQSKIRPRVHQKIQNYFENMIDGAISPILRLKINRSACNMKCEHCCEEPYMTRDLIKKTGKKDPRKQMDLKDYKKLSIVHSDSYLRVKEFEFPKSSKINHMHIDECNFKNNDILIISVPSPTLENNLSLIENKVSKNTQIISASKGFDKNGDTLSTLIKNKLKIRKENIGVLSGPNLSSEILMNKPATSLLSFNDINKADKLRDIISNEVFRIYSGDDVIGSEIGGALKNIIAIGCGIIDKMNLGDNAKSAFISRGVREIVRFGISFNAKEYTFYGLSGIGDLIATCNSSLSRNWQLGYSLASGKTLDEFIAEKEVTVEGANASEIVNRVALEKGLEMPIIKMTYKVVHQNYNPVDAIREFMSRNPSKERN